MMGVIHIEITKTIASTTIISTIPRFKIVLQLSQSKTMEATINIIILRIRLEIQAIKIATLILIRTLQEVVIIITIISILHSFSKEQLTGKLGDQDRTKILFQTGITINHVELILKIIHNMKVVILKRHNNSRKKISKMID